MRHFYIANLILIIIAVFSRCYLYIQNYDFWHDDAALSVIIWYNSFADIFHGNLYYDQAPALLFILLVKILAIPFGDSEYVLRFIPFVFGIALFPLAYIFSIKHFNEKFAFIFLSLLICNDALLFYAVQFKQYSAEAFFSLLLVHLFLIYRKDISINSVIPLKIFLVSIISCMFGNTMFFVVLGIFLCLVFEQFKNKNLLLFLKKNGINLILFIAFSYIYYSWISGTLKDDWMHIFWFKYSTFSFIDFLSYFLDFTYNKYINAILFSILFLGGLFFLFRNKNILFLQIILIFLICITLYFLEIYPLGNQIYLSKSNNLHPACIRTSIYLIPIFLIPIAFALEKIFIYKKAFIGVFIVFFGLVIYTNGECVIKGADIISLSNSVALLNKFSTENSAVVINDFVEPQLLYKLHRSNRITDTYIFTTSFKYSAGIKEKYPATNKRYFANNMSIENSIKSLEQMGKTEIFFIYRYDTEIAAQKITETLDYVTSNYPKENVFKFISNTNNIYFIAVKLVPE